MDENLQQGMGQSEGMGMVPLEMGMEQGMPGEGMATPEQRQELLGMIDDIRQKLGSFNATRFAGKNKVERIKKETLRRVFEILQLNGVDLEKRESVNDFLAKLQASNPKLAEWFEASMDVLLGEEDPMEEVAQGGDMAAVPEEGMAAMPPEGQGMGLENMQNENNYEEPNPTEIPPQGLS